MAKRNSLYVGKIADDKTVRTSLIGSAAVSTVITGFAWWRMNKRINALDPAYRAKQEEKVLKKAAKKAEKEAKKIQKAADKAAKKLQKDPKINNNENNNNNGAAA